MTAPPGAAPLSSNHPEPSRYPELFFGLIGPAGADLKIVFKILRKSLLEVGYKVSKQEIRLSKLIEELTHNDFSALPEDERVDKLMNEGTRIREAAGHGGAVALLALAGIDKVRRSEFQNFAERNAYILHSLKHPEEVETFRNIYGRFFFAISAYG